MYMKNCKYIIGIDEVGRGPIAGPVTVGAVLLPSSYSWHDFKGLKDSKKLTKKDREAWFSQVRGMGGISYKVSSVSEKVIDKKGIVYSTRLAILRSLNKLDVNP
ncbi:MAG TPA: ribonuclease HII, partial [Candidatus Kaiserbacteria bacterium]|nr:ribonuclease HII [Candidatus Kaiserbacteria bacterium]